MKQSVTRYVVMDSSNNSFWKITSFYYNTKECAAYLSSFTESLFEANLMSEEAAKETLELFKINDHFTMSLDNLKVLKLDINSLVVSPVSITYEKNS